MSQMPPDQTDVYDPVREEWRPAGNCACGQRVAMVLRDYPAGADLREWREMRYVVPIEVDTVGRLSTRRHEDCIGMLGLLRVEPEREN